MPRIEGEPGQALNEVWVYLTEQEARELLAALEHWRAEGHEDPDWHTHVGQAPGPEVSIAVER